MLYTQLIELFSELFFDEFNTRLEAGFDEPIYKPRDKPRDKSNKNAEFDGNLGQAIIGFRENYSSSALHEISHWCIASSERRKLEDYGYWYEPDGRSAEQQAEFQKVEVKPQALEWIFSLAAGIKFRISLDNLDGDVEERGGAVEFSSAVAQQAKHFISSGMPGRADVFYRGLLALSKRGVLCEDDFTLELLL